MVGYSTTHVCQLHLCSPYMGRHSVTVGDARDVSTETVGAGSQCMHGLILRICESCN
ncbi:hypothetical protein CHLRE_01g026016v5 [Chlamydomonas reinhardtii]|uniref:Uncharacterized protein n=1 Tax=Chlamydomonas reinhardtii TaxID=3055 RepID=A0A2K3E6E0_CHLRE|nr:uncharacterized protein CHLRE_01g026016v5 [Chlamydomonas reinhardtii]PNW88359.1 hypothetical protein CHLRE_01g026016v5 [Chlamydomonas reinhardtii]